MSTVPFDLEQLAFDLDRSGFAGREPIVRQVVHLARAYNVGGAAVGVLADQSAPEVARMRAFGLVATALLPAPATGDRPLRLDRRRAARAGPLLDMLAAGAIASAIRRDDGSRRGRHVVATLAKSASRRSPNWRR